MSSTTLSGLSASRKAHSWVEGIGGAVRRLAESWAGSRRRRQDLRRLSSLSDRTLADIGMTRAEVQSLVCYGTADGTRRARGTPARRQGGNLK